MIEGACSSIVVELLVVLVLKEVVPVVSVGNGLMIVVVPVVVVFVMIVVLSGIVVTNDVVVVSFTVKLAGLGELGRTKSSAASTIMAPTSMNPKSSIAPCLLNSI
jgi:hypothetical protein